MYDEYLTAEVVPFIYAHCSGWQPIATLGVSLGAYHAANALFKHPDVFKRCFAMSGVYDMRRFMDGMYDDNFYFNNPVDYLSNLSDPAGSTTRPLPATSTSSPGRARGSSPGPSYHLPSILSARASRTRSTTGDRWAATTGRTGAT